jgi:threonine dehydratase
MRRSLEAGHIIPVGPDAPPTLCDALQTTHVAPITFGILRERDAQVVVVSDAEVTGAVRWAWVHHQLVVEPGGAAGLAAVLAGKAEPRDGIVVILSGGNVDPALHARLIS